MENYLMNDSYTIVVIIIIIVALILVLISILYKYYKLKLNFNDNIKSKFENWTNNELSESQKKIEATTEKEYKLKLQEWISENKISIRQQAIISSKSISLGQISEQLAPYFPNFPYNPKDVKFIGDPIDIIIFDGLKEGYVRNIVFLEIKTGSSRLNKNEKLVKEAVDSGRIEWLIHNIKL